MLMIPTCHSLVKVQVTLREGGLTSDDERQSRWVKKKLNVNKTQILLLARKRRVQELE